jgi:hypothetical protein
MHLFYSCYYLLYIIIIIIIFIIIINIIIIIIIIIIIVYFISLSFIFSPIFYLNVSLSFCFVLFLCIRLHSMTLQSFKYLIISFILIHFFMITKIIVFKLNHFDLKLHDAVHRCKRSLAGTHLHLQAERLGSRCA